MRYRITVRGEGVELRGYVDGTIERLESLSYLMKPFGIVVASEADDDYDPFKNEDEYTRMMVGRVDEAEGIVDQIKAIRSNFPEKCDVHDNDDITCGWKHMIAGIDEVLK